MELGIRSPAPPGAGAETAAARGRDAATIDHSLAARLTWITGLRLLFLLLLLGATATLYLRGELERYPFSSRVVFATIAFGFALGAVYAAVLRSGSRLPQLGWSQIVLDQI